MAKFSVAPAQRAQDRRRGSLVPRGIMFLMYRTRNSPVLYIRTPLSIGPRLCELLRISLMSTSSTELRLIGFLGSSLKSNSWKCVPPRAFSRNQFIALGLDVRAKKSVGFV